MQVVKVRRNIPGKYATNLCRQAPVIPSRCTVEHGMLMNLQGKDVPTLYAGQVLRHRDKLVARVGAGLFVHGGNPVYFTSKGSSDDVSNAVHSVLKVGNMVSLF